jgi:hypothetical protein
VSGFVRRFGASPVHLLAHLVLLPLALWAILELTDARAAGDILLWFVAGLLLHDLVLLPAYSALDRVGQRARLRGVAVVNYVRFPAVISAVLFLAFVGQITGEGRSTLAYVSGMDPTGYLERWLLATAVVFGASALLLAVQLVRAQPRDAAADGPDLGAVRGW